MADIFVALHYDSVAQQSAHVARQQLFNANHVARYCNTYLLPAGVKVCAFLVLLVSLTAYNINQRAILLYTDLHGERF